jgi:hypothetical protein
MPPAAQLIETLLELGFVDIKLMVEAEKVEIIARESRHRGRARKTSNAGLAFV